jgi:hypothetical protein
VIKPHFLLEGECGFLLALVFGRNPCFATENGRLDFERSVGSLHKKGRLEMRMQMIRLVIGFFGLIVLALGCAPSPVYQVKYDYRAPETEEGRGCTQPCETAKIQCEEIIKGQWEQEKIDSQQAYQRCLLSQKSGARSPILCTEPPQSIKPDYSYCLASYNRCFERCGGRVEEKNVCISNCK